jgi:hypothetical protein
MKRPYREFRSSSPQQSTAAVKPVSVSRMKLRAALTSTARLPQQCFQLVPRHRSRSMPG